MNLKSTLLLFPFITLLAFSLFAQNSTQEIIDEFFTKYEKSPMMGIDFIFETNKWMIENNSDGISNVKTQLSNVLNQIGSYQGFDQLAICTLGDNYKVINYMVRYERQPLRFIFIFYKPKNTWQIQNFQFNDSFEDLIISNNN